MKAELKRPGQNPAGLTTDGGDVELVEVGADGIVKVKLTGACGGCPMATITRNRASNGS